MGSVEGLFLALDLVSAAIERIPGCLPAVGEHVCSGCWLCDVFQAAKKTAASYNPGGWWWWWWWRCFCFLLDYQRLFGNPHPDDTRCSSHSGTDRGHLLDADLRSVRRNEKIACHVTVRGEKAEESPEKRIE